MLNPFIKDRKILAVYSTIWFLIAAVHFAVLLLVLNINMADALLDSIIFNLIYFGLGISLWYTANFNSIETYTAPKITINHIAAAVITSGIWILTGYFILVKIVKPIPAYETFLLDTLVWRFLIGILFYLIIVAIDYVIIYYNNFQAKQLRETELNSLVKEAELKTLKYQINPHFIFNSLNSISSLTISAPKRAQEMTIKLSSFLRATLSKNETQKNKLSDEIKNAQLYLDIEKIRFEEKFNFIKVVDKECSEVEVPSMILQPLFENAIKHGVYESIEQVSIILTCKQENEYMKITVENNFDPEAISKKGEGIGIKNIQNRLKLIYNQDNLLTVEKKEDIFRAHIYIPVDKGAQK
jgi:sensor histidine kinase YesM